MTELELLDAVRTGLEALSAPPLSTFEVYLFDQEGKLPDERIILNISGGEEQGLGIAGGGNYGGRFKLLVEVEMRAEFPFADTDANRDKMLTAIEQLRQFVRSNRRISAGGDTSYYASVTGAETGFYEDPAPDDAKFVARRYRTAIVRGTWTIPEETSTSG